MLCTVYCMCCVLYCVMSYCVRFYIVKRCVMLYGTVYCVMSYCVLCSVLYVVWCCVSLYNDKLHCIVFHYSVLFDTMYILYYTVLYSTILKYTVLGHTVLCCTICIQYRHNRDIYIDSYILTCITRN